MLKIGVCDDEKLIAGYLENLLINLCQREHIPIDIDVFYSGLSLEKEISRGTKYDILYLDIQMENGDGISVAKMVRTMDDNVILIFVSGYDKYMIELFRLDVFAFIRKPVDVHEFENLFLQANQKISNKKFYYTFRYKCEEYKIPCSEILYFESNGRKVRIYLRDKEINEFNGKLSDVVVRLSEGKIPFMRIHQSYLVNYHLIKSRTKAEVTLIDGKKLPISEDRQKEFDKQYSILLGGEVDV